MVVCVSVDIQRRNILITDEAKTIRIIAPLESPFTRLLAGRIFAYVIALRTPQGGVSVASKFDGMPIEVQGW